MGIARAEGVLGLISGSNPPLVNHQGTHPSPSIHLVDDSSGLFSHTSHAGSMPKMDFPKFDGDKPRLWQEQCEIYFEIYGVSKMMKTSLLLSTSSVQQRCGFRQCN